MILAVAAVLRLPALGMGFAMDDYAQLAMLAGTYPVERAPWDLFSFCDGSPDDIARLVSVGGFPWWTDPQLELSTLRPLASLSMWLDVQMFGRDPRAFHLQTFVWWLAMLGVVARLLLRVLPARWALLAFALYALDECHTQPVAWLANRNAILATTFAMAAVDAHVRWREYGLGSRWRVAGLVALALASGESALAGVGFLFAYEIVAGHGSRWRSWWPSIAVVLAWLAVHRVLGYGAVHSGVYLDPLAEPVAWVIEAATRAPILLADLFLALPTGELALGGRGFGLQRALGLAALVGVVLWLRFTPRSASDASRLRWFALATIVSLVPMLSAFVSARLLVTSAIGAHVLVAACLLDGLDAVGVAWFRRGLAIALMLAHGVFAPWSGMRELLQLRSFAAAADRAAMALPVDPPADARVVVLAAADPSTLLYPALIRGAHGLPRIASLLVLSAAPSVHRIRRADARTLELEVEGGLLRSHVEAMFRRGDRLPRSGDRVDTADATIEVRAVDDDGFPVRVAFTFATPLDDPRRVFVIATPAGFVRYPLGPVGAWLQLPPASAPQ